MTMSLQHKHKAANEDHYPRAEDHFGQLLKNNKISSKAVKIQLQKYTYLQIQTLQLLAKTQKLPSV